MRRFAGRPEDTAKPSVFADVTWLSLLALVVVSISRVHQAVAIVGKGRPALVFFAAACIGAVLHGRLCWTNLTRYWAGYVLLALAVLACLSAPFGLSFGASANFFVSSYAKTLLVSVMLIICLRRWRDLSRLTWAYVIGVALLAGLSVFLYGISKTQSNDTFDANDVGLIMVTGIPLAVVTLQTSRRAGRIVSAIALILIALTIARSLSRGAFLGLVVVGIATIMSLRAVSVPGRFGIVVAVAITIFAGAPKGYWHSMETITAPTEDYNWDSMGGRKQIAKRGIGYMVSHPLTGIGLNNFERAEGTISEKARLAPVGKGVVWSAPHNSYVQIGAELGVFGLLLYAALILGSIVAGRRLHGRLPAGWRTGSPDERFLYALTNALPVALLGFAVSSFFVSFAYVDVPYVLVAMSCGAWVLVTRRLDATQPVAVVHRGSTPAPRARRVLQPEVVS